MNVAQPQTPLSLGVRAFCQTTGISRSLVYVLMGRGDLKSVRVAGRRLIPYSEAERLIRCGTV